MKKNIFIFITAIGLIVVFSLLSPPNKLKEKELNKTSENEIENIYNEIHITTYSFARNNLEEMYKNHEFIAIIHVDEIHPATTYRKKNNEYIMPYTPGDATIISNLKGDFASDHIQFLRLGGTVSYEEYKKSLYPREREKLSQILEKGNKKITHIRSMEENDINIEKDKLYMAYMNRNDDFNTENEYTIEAFEYGLREVKSEDDSLKNISKILIKNNKTGKSEPFEQSVSKEILKKLNLLSN